MRMNLRSALEDSTVEATGDDTHIVIKGPLAEIYGRALNVMYAKPDPLTDEVIMESMAQDAQYMQKVIDAIAEQTEEVENTELTTVYGVAKSEITDQTIVDITRELSTPVAKAPTDFVLIIDGTQPGANSELSGVPQERLMVLEHMVLAHKGRVFGSLLEYAKTL
jgi:hypothetical protein